MREESLLLLTLRYKYVGMTVVDSMCPWTFAFFQRTNRSCGGLWKNKCEVGEVFFFLCFSCLMNYCEDYHIKPNKNQKLTLVKVTLT